MIIRGSVTKQETMDVTFAEVARLVAKEIRTRKDIPSDARLENGKMVCDERDHRHGSVGTEILEDNPSAETIDALNFIKRLDAYVLEFHYNDTTKREPKK